MDVVIPLLSATAIAVGLYALHKIRRVHLVALQTARDTGVTREEVRQIYPQLAAHRELTALLGFRAPLPRLRGWAASPDFLLELARQATARTPSTIVEASSGASTLVLARVCQINGKGFVFSLEHDPQYGARTRELLVQHGLQDWARVLDAPLRSWPELGNARWYSLDVLPEDLGPIQMLVIDGPPTDTGKRARYPALPLLKSRLDPGCVVVLDDAGRNDERHTIEAWQNEVPQLVVELLPFEKGAAVLTFAPREPVPASGTP